MAVKDKRLKGLWLLKRLSRGIIGGLGGGQGGTPYRLSVYLAGCAVALSSKQVRNLGTGTPVVEATTT